MFRKAPQKASVWANCALLQSKNRSIHPQKYHQWAKSGHVLSQISDKASPINEFRHYGPHILVFLEFLLSQQCHFEGHIGGPQRSITKLMSSTLWILASWTIMGCLKPKLMSLATSRGTNKAVKEAKQTRPPQIPFRHLWVPQLPSVTPNNWISPL